VSATNTKQSTVITDNSSTELRYVGFEVNKVFGLFKGDHIIEMYVFIAPLKVVNDTLICKFLFYNKNVLEKLNDPFVYVKMVELSNHCLLVLQVFFI
jgi:hypothetical protein